MAPTWDPSTYGDRFAPVYDDWYHGRSDTAAAVDALTALAGDGAVLELGVGTGRLAVPLAARGIIVEGVDASAAMLVRLRAKPGGDRVHVVVGDMAAPPVAPGRCSVVVVAANTIFNLDTADAQAACIAAAARALRPGGRLVIEAWVPDPDRLSADDVDVVRVRTIEPDRVILTASKVDPARQRLETVLLELNDAGGVRLFPARLRYAGPDELDDLAAAAGLTLEWRTAGWDGRPFTAASDTHVSAWVKQPSGADQRTS